ncbi:MAG: RNA-binding S4 domain-containing protein [Thermoactinomyces sp.]
MEGGIMRLDKFLKVSFLVKRRTLAKEVCDQGRVTVNGKTAKAGTTVAVGDEVSIRYGQKKVTVRVEKLLNSVRKEDAGQMYTLLREEAVHNDQKA